MLSESKHINNLDLRDMGLYAQDMEELVELIQLNQVKIDFLNLYRNNINDEGAIILSRLTAESIGRLNVGYCDLSDKGAIALIHSQLTKIDLSDNSLTDKSVNVFLQEGKQTYLIFYRNRRISEEKLLAAEEKVEQNKQLAAETASASPLLASSFLNKSPLVNLSLQDDNLSAIEMDQSGQPGSIFKA